MKAADRAQKLKTLQDALEGRTQSLQRLQQQRRKEAMPYLEVHGIIDVRQCSPKLMDLIVVDGESIIDGKHVYKPLSEWIHQYNTFVPTSTYVYRSDGSIGSIEATDTQYDAEPVTYIEVKHRNYATQTLRGGRIADLRRMFDQCAASVEQSFILLCFETDVSRYERLTDRA